MKITRIRIRDFRAIEQLDASVAPAGMIVEGSNDRAKSTILKAVLAALTARDVGPEAIRIGAEESEILIDTDDVSVRRLIEPDGTKVSVERDMGGVRAKIPKPANWLRDVLGVAPIDPLDLVSAKTKEERRLRRDRVLACVPAPVTKKQLEAWTGETISGPLDPNNRGLEIISQLHASYYEKRTAANAKAREARRLADESAKAVAQLPEKPADARTAEQVHEERELAAQALARLSERNKAAREAEERTKSTRARVEDLRKRADAEVDGITDPSSDEFVAAEKSLASWCKRVCELKDELAAIQKELNEAESSVSQADFSLRALKTRTEQVTAAKRRSEDMRQQAADLEAAISAASVEAPTLEEMVYAGARLGSLDKAYEQARYHEQNDVVRQQAFDAEQAAKAYEKEADRLDKIVRTLLNDAPAELMTGADGIPGLSVRGDQIYIDGVDIDGLCQRDQLAFALRIAKRANSKSKLLFVDGLERVASDQLDEFVRVATEGGYQLLATRVTSGPRVIEALEPQGGVWEHEQYPILYS